jgi:hypothetical protein
LLRWSAKQEAGTARLDLMVLTITGGKASTRTSRR